MKQTEIVIMHTLRQNSYNVLIQDTKAGHSVK